MNLLAWTFSWTWFFNTATGILTFIALVIGTATGWWSIPFKVFGRPIILTKIWWRHRKNKEATNWSALYIQLDEYQKENRLRHDEVSKKIDRIIINQKITRELAGIVYWESDSLGNVYYVCPELCEILRCGSKDFKRKSWYGLVVNDDRDRIVKLYEESIHNVGLFVEEFRFRCCDCEDEIKVLARLTHTIDAEGKLIDSVMSFKILAADLMPM
jgi:hypothetical protein